MVARLHSHVFRVVLSRRNPAHKNKRGRRKSIVRSRMKGANRGARAPTSFLLRGCLLPAPPAANGSDDFEIADRRTQAPRR